jgi:phospholipase A-2-activating protein
MRTHLMSLLQWDTANKAWQKIGDVVDAVGSGRKQLYEGKEYDYVFDVDIKDGAPPLKLPYNANGESTLQLPAYRSCFAENPYQAAHRFLGRNDLPLTYIDEVAKFIENNTAAVNLGSNEQYVDPYTGASRYIPRGNSSATAAPR